MQQVGKGPAELPGQCLPRSQNHWPKSRFLIAAAPSPGCTQVSWDVTNANGCSPMRKRLEHAAVKGNAAQIWVTLCAFGLSSTWRKKNTARSSKLSRVTFKAFLTSSCQGQLTAMPFSQESLWSQLTVKTKASVWTYFTYFYNDVKICVKSQLSNPRTTHWITSLAIRAHSLDFAKLGLSRPRQYIKTKEVFWECSESRKTHLRSYKCFGPKLGEQKHLLMLQPLQWV